MDMSAQMLLFAKVVEQGSISAASRKMGQTPSAVSKQIALLEDQVRHRLLNRTRTGVSPTAEGLDFYVKCKALAEKFHEAEAHILSLDGHPRGRLRVASSVAFGKSQLVPVLPKFLAAYPDIQLSLEITDRNIDLAEEGFDAAICFGEQHRKPDIVVRKFMPSKRLLCASPAYLKRKGTPKNFADLARHECLRIAGEDKRNDWSLGGEGSNKGIEINGAFEGNSTDVLYRAALAGLGIARLPCYLVSRQLDSGELVRVLPEYEIESAGLAVLFAERRNLAPKVRVFIDFLVEEFRHGASEQIAAE